VASANAGRAALLVAALTTQPALLFAATEDSLHQEFRRAAMPDSLALVDSLRAAAIPAVISGAGPSVLAFGTTGCPVDMTSWTPASWVGRELAVEATGAAVATHC
jgi:homoserine kinase